VDDRIARPLISVFRRLPRFARMGLITAGSTPYHVGALCIVRRIEDDHVLLVRHSYRARWGLPGGLAKRGERAEHAAVREVREEVGIAVRLLGDPAVIIEPRDRRVDVVFPAQPVHAHDAVSARSTSPEIVEAAWFPARDLPPLQSETAAAFIALDRRYPDGPCRDGAAS
jgi:8-oxo-dGTP diphosphatase